jgi:hypothetical protein
MDSSAPAARIPYRPVLRTAVEIEDLVVAALS